ncbi:beta-glucosidase [Bacillus cereus]|uniref:glycoside hydrolase family 3 protein n=1 Tax=Bacillus cereus TaxID=1396 RepID=UPI000BF4CF53|nr:glycoside hydrolase family 3 N-terminal domain-containing protein [Bacillus cereus]PFA20174.1 beta-glucosidase [Bacillus cereus]PGZ15174.1 beta-glucosidase [Bacillus cereus]
MLKPEATLNYEPSIQYIENKKGPQLGYSTTSGVQIIQKDDLFFKNLSKDGILKSFEDWRLPAEERAKDLASRLSIEEIAGLMLYSTHQMIPARTDGWFGGTYSGKPYADSGAKPWDLTDEQIAFLTRDYIRHMLVMVVETPEYAARWNNRLQALIEGEGLGIPANTSSDPRHGFDSSTEFNAGAGAASRVSRWPEPLGLAATFDPDILRQFGDIASKEYRALGMTTALSPQIDIATDPRWFRFNGTFGEDSNLSTDMARAYVDGFQTSKDGRELANGWGFDSVNAMVKHWPGGGSGEGGRDAHFACGKYAVYPGNNFEEHLKPFTEGAFQLEEKTGQASAIMPYYTISYDQDKKNGENVGNSYNSYLITDLLREKYNYDGVVCTDWSITNDENGNKDDVFSGKSWGVEHLSVAERHYKLIMAGVDQFGGNNEVAPVLEAYQMGVEEHGEEFMRSRFEKSAVRLLLNTFRLGLFENPYLQPEESEKIVNCPEFSKAGYEAQQKSIVLLKNKGQTLPIKGRKKVYISKRYLPESKSSWGSPMPEKLYHPVDLTVVANYFDVVIDPEEADFGLVFIESPNSGVGYSREDAENGGNGYVPISLQYKPYTAEFVREQSIAGDPRENDVLNRSYKGKTVTTYNSHDLEAVLDTKKKMQGKPVIVSLMQSNPTIVKEFEAEVDAIFTHFGMEDKVIMELLKGSFEPSGLLPFQMPANMKTVETQFEDVAHDMECHVDEEGNIYDFAFGLNWEGVIEDNRTEKYRKK